MPMRSGEKVRLIESIQDLIAGRSEARRRLILDQFGFQVREQDSYESDEEYVISVLSCGPEAGLANLLTFLRGEDAQPVHSDIDQPWGGLPVRVFLSHVHQERHLVGAIKKVLAENYALDAFVAHDDIHPSKRWREVIKSGLASCDLFVAFLHDGYHASQWCDQEAGWALGRDILILTVRPDGVERRDGFLEERQDLSLSKATGSLEQFVAREVFTAALSDPRTRDAGTRSLVEAFVNSWSYDTTRYLWGLIDKVPRFEPEQLRRLEYAVETNGQVYDANVNGAMVKDLVKALVARHEPPSAVVPDEPPF